MAILKTKILFVVAGYVGDVEKPLSILRRKFSSAEYAFIARSLPTNPAKRSKYAKDLGEKVVDFIFGKSGATGFCRSNNLPCSVEVDGKREKIKTCRAEARPTACYRARPRMIVFITTDDLYRELFDRFGRASLIFKAGFSGEMSADTIENIIHDAIPNVNAIQDYMAHLPLDIHAPRMPMNNYQNRAEEIARLAQERKESFSVIMEEFHNKLHDSKFKNPKKPYMRGAYMFNDRVGFQRDRLHSGAQIGTESREDVFHLINAYHMYGYPVEPGLHFDVVERNGGTLNEVFEDILDGRETSKGSTHVNITPCDRLT